MLALGFALNIMTSDLKFNHNLEKAKIKDFFNCIEILAGIPLFIANKRQKSC